MVAELVALVLPLGLDSFAASAALGAAGAPARRTSLLMAGAEAGMPLVGLALGAPLGRAIGGVADWLAIAVLLALGVAGLLERDEAPVRGAAERGGERPAAGREGEGGAGERGGERPAAGREGEGGAGEGGAGERGDERPAARRDREAAPPRPGRRRAARRRGAAALLLALSVSLDELALGFSIGLLGLPVVPVLVAIAVQALVLSQLGVRLGARLSRGARDGVQRLAAVIPAAVGLALLVAELT